MGKTLAVAAAVALLGCYESCAWQVDAASDVSGTEADVSADTDSAAADDASGSDSDAVPDGDVGGCVPACGPIERCTPAGHCVPSFGTWVEVPPGTFVMGSVEMELGRFDHETAHSVTLTRGFAMLDTETTQGEFDARMGYEPSSHADCPACPVETVNWHEAAAYCNALSAAAGRPSCYACRSTLWMVSCSPSASYATPYDCPGYRLPTEAEWEYAARAGTATATYNGDLDARHLACEEPNAVLDSIAWFCGNGPGPSRTVAGRAPSPWNLHDMLGNVREWCDDSWDGTDYPSDAVTNPWDTRVLRDRAFRGGSRLDYARRTRAAHRGGQPADSRHDTLGFRPVRTLP